MLTNFGPAAVVLGLALGRRLELAIDERILDALITRNLKHFPSARCGNIAIFTPEKILARIQV